MDEQKENTRYIVRIAGKDLDGSLAIERSLAAIKGISYRMARNVAVAFEKKTGISHRTKIGELKEEQDRILEDVLTRPQEYGIPSWNFNRRRDYSTGTDMHLVSNDLDFSKRQDLQRLSEIKSYRGLRLGWGLTVRGQRTRSTHRKKGGVVGVMKKDAKEAAAPAKGPAAAKPAEAKPKEAQKKK